VTRSGPASLLARSLASHAKRLRSAIRKDLDGAPDHPLRALSPTSDDHILADSVAQTVTFVFFAARWLDTDAAFHREHAFRLLSSSSEPSSQLFFTSLRDPDVTRAMDDLVDSLSVTPVRQVFAGHGDPVIHFYQHFLDAYAPALRRRMGVYATPDAVVRYMVASLDRLARLRLGLRLGLADPVRWGAYAVERGIPLPEGARDDDFVVRILEPSAGTGTFLLQVLRGIFATMTEEYEAIGLGEPVAAAAWKTYVRESLLPRLEGFEVMMAPWAVAHLRLTWALRRGLAEETGRDPDLWGFRCENSDHLRLRLANALGPPESRAPVLVVIGNPPYARTSKSSDASLRWVIQGKVPGRTTDKSLFDDLRDPARERTVFSHLRSLSDRYVYFWRWAIWRAFEHTPSPGLLGFITNSTWLTGPAFVGLRAIARDVCDEIWTVDLGGDGRSTRPDPNVFGVETPVAITTLVRTTCQSQVRPATAWYRRVEGVSGEHKLQRLDSVLEVGTPLDGDWTRAGDASSDPLVPGVHGDAWRRYPALADLFPWQQPGCLASRTWPVAPHPSVLVQRWTAFVGAPVEARPRLFVTARTGRNVFTKVPGYAPLASLDEDAPPGPIVRYGFRSFDRQWILYDPRLLKTESPPLWSSRSDRQIYLCSLLRSKLSAGPAVTVSAHVPDFHCFCGRGGKDVIPLYRDAAATQPNVTLGLLEVLGGALGLTVTPGDLAAYVVAVLSAPQYQERFAVELATPGPRVPLTADASLWKQAVELGKRLIWLQTFGERLQDPASGRGLELPDVPGLAWTPTPREMPESASAISYQASSQLLEVGRGRVTGLLPEVWGFAVSGMPVVRKWLGYRCARRAGRGGKSNNPLDLVGMTVWPEQWSVELLDLLRVLTLTVAAREEQGELLMKICAGRTVSAADLPVPGRAERLSERDRERATR
jgi:hypothetical protein